MSRSISSMTGGAETRRGCAKAESDYLFERPRLVLTMLDLMEKLERERGVGTDREEVNVHAS